MPRSKRAKVVHMSKVEKKGKDLTLKTFANVQAAVAQHPYLYVFAVDNMRNTYLKDVRVQLPDSRLFFGKTKVMAKALGSTAATEPQPGTAQLAAHLHGAVGLLASPRAPPAVAAFAAAFRPRDFARAGTRAARAFALPAGILHSRGGALAAADDVPLAAALEPSLRALGVPTRLVRGQVVLEDAVPVCEAGQVLDSRQTALLKMFGVAMAEFRVELRAVWTAATGEVAVMGEEGAVVGMEVDEEGGDEDDD